MLGLDNLPVRAPGEDEQVFLSSPASPGAVCVPSGSGEGEQRGCPGRERPWPRCLCSARCLAHTKAVATFVASVNRLALSLAASRHLLLQPGTEQMPVWSRGGRETPPELQYFTFLPTALPSWQPQCSDSSAPPADPVRLLLCSPPALAAAPAPSPWQGSFRCKSLRALGVWCSVLAQSEKHGVSITLCQAGRRSRAGEPGRLQGSVSNPSAPQLLGDTEI